MNTNLQLEQARQAMGRWALLDAQVRAPKESLAVVSQIITHLYADTRAVRVALQSMAKELGAMRARIDALEAELRSLRLSEDETPPPHLPPPSPTSIPPMRDLHREEPLPLIEPEEVFEPYPDPGADLRARIRELSNVIETAFPPPSKGAQR